MMRRYLFVSGLVILTATALRAAGTEGFTFLRMGNGAEAAGMGETHTALAEGAQAVYWNPAGLGISKNAEITFSHLQYFEDSRGQYAALALPLQHGKKGTLGFSITRFGVDNIESRDAQSTLMSSSIEQEDQSLQVSYGYRLFSGDGEIMRQGLFVGAGLKSISEKLAGESVSTLAYDAGLQYKPGDKMARYAGEWSRRMTLGVAVLNLGSSPKFDAEEVTLPRSTRVGLGYTHFLWGDALNLETDWELLPDGENRWMVGGEFWLKNMLALRTGFVQGQDIGDSYRVGAGFRFQAVQLDYAFSPYGEELGNVHRISLSFRFGDGAGRTTGLKDDLLQFHLSRARETLAAGSYHDAVLEANQVLAVDSHNTEALQILLEAGEKMKQPDTLPQPSETTPQ